MTPAVDHLIRLALPRHGMRRSSRRAGRARSLDHRSFDPVRIGTLESKVWVAYYQRRWLSFAVFGAICARRGFGLSWPETLRCSWLVMRANQRWAPFPDNDPAGAQQAMTACYRVLSRRYGVPSDPALAAALDVDWWRIHRELQHGLRSDASALLEAIARFWAALYEAPLATLRPAAAERARAMQISDRWVAAGSVSGSELIPAARSALVSSYTQLLEAVQVR